VTAEQAPNSGTGSRIDPYVGQYAQGARGMVASEIRRVALLERAAERAQGA
jgi:hypothetical protein